MDLFNDSNETVQKLYGKQICSNFPAYKTLWDEFIGERELGGILEPYETEFPNTPSEIKIILQEEYKQISIVHYSIFFNFASAHEDFNLILKAPAEKNDKEYFLYLKCINSIYSNLGNIFDLLERLFANVLTLVNKKGKQKFKKYLKLKLAWPEYLPLEETIKKKRNILAHAYSVMPMVIHKNDIKIPLSLVNPKGNDKTVSELLAEDKKEWVSLQNVLKEDIEKMEKLVNKIDLLFINELQEFKRKGGILIRYPANSTSYGMQSLPSLSARPVSTSSTIIIKPSGCQT
ncbi:MAG: hypothetical protein HY209_01225 [Candidatus Omnitrophica bacterium]|nr:hypothetical protein [Candidatus Omnitrophota bacterium]